MNSFLTSRAGAVMAGAAVLATLSGIGGAVAAGQIGSADIRDGALHSVDLAKGSVQSPAILNGTVKQADLSSDLQALLAVPGTKGAKGDTGEKGAKGDTGEKGAKGDTGADGARGPQGAQGTAGAPGAPGVQGVPEGVQAPGVPGVQGVPGDDGLSGYRRVISVVPINAANQTFAVSCPGGTNVVGGGVSGWDDAYVISSFPSDDSTWTVRVGSGSDGLIRVYAVCATVTPAPVL